MTGAKTKIAAGVYLFADHLDSVLAAGEDLLALDLATQPSGAETGNDEHLTRLAALRELVERMRTLEMVIAARVLQARVHAQAMARRGPPELNRILELFVAGTATLEDAVGELGDSTRADFQTGEQPLAYLRSRAVVAADTAGSGQPERVRTDEGFLVAARIHLGTLLDLTATLLDALDVLYNLYPDAEDEADRAGDAADAA